MVPGGSSAVDPGADTQDAENHASVPPGPPADDAPVASGRCNRHHQLSGLPTEDRHFRPAVGAGNGDRAGRRTGSTGPLLRGEESVGINDLAIGIIDPAGVIVAVAPFEGETALASQFQSVFTY